MRSFLIILLSFLSISFLFAHAMWITTATNGLLNQKHEVKIYFGEFTYGVIEEAEGDSFKKKNELELFVIDPEGNKTPIKTTIKKDHYSGTCISSNQSGPLTLNC